MNKIKTLKLLSGLLLLINIGLISFMIFNKGPRERNHKKAEAHLKKTFGFNDNQMVKFGEFRDEHRQRGHQLSDQLAATSKAYYNTVDDDTSKRILLDSIVKLSKEVYLNNDRHFNDMRSICNPEQLKNISRFIDNLMDKQRPPKREKPKKRKRSEG
jgi:hypothetical protein